MIVADDAVINRVGRVKLEISFKVRFAERCEGRHVGELSSSMMPCNFVLTLCVTVVRVQEKTPQGAEKRGRSNARSAPAGKFSCLVQYRKGARGGRHQEAVAAARQASDIFRVRMWMAAGHVV